MHMNSASHLLPEDRPEFERAVDEALRDKGRRPGLAAAGERISTGQLRVMALSAATSIASDASEEYERYVALRTRARRPGADGGSPAAGPASPSLPAPASRGESDTDRTDEGEQPGGTGGLSLAGVGEGVSETTGAGLLAMVSVLVPLLAGTAAVIFLLLGNVLRVVSPEPSIAAPMRGAGWVFAVLAAAGIIVAMAELWLTAVRNGSGARGSRSGDALGSGADGTAGGGGRGESRLTREVAAARTLWREALLERGIVPFLERALAEAADGGSGVHDEGGTGTGPASAPEAPRPSTRTGREERTPRLGYSGPDFSSRTPSDGQEHNTERGKERESLRPRYSRPDWSSPDYGGPEHKPE